MTSFQATSVGKRVMKGVLQALATAAFGLAASTGAAVPAAMQRPLDLFAQKFRESLTGKTRPHA